MKNYSGHALKIGNTMEVLKHLAKECWGFFFLVMTLPL